MISKFTMRSKSCVFRGLGVTKRTSISHSLEIGLYKTWPIFFTQQVAWRKVAIDYPLTVGKTTFDQREDLSVNYKDLKDQEKGLSQWDLIIKQAKPRHSGMYECQISSKKVYTHYVYLKVLGKL